METIIRLTTAPMAYDGFGTETLEITGATDRMGKPWRIVTIVTAHADWQRGRYFSGMYPCITVEEYDEWVRLGLI